MVTEHQMTIVPYFLVFPGSELDLPQDETRGRIDSLLVLLGNSLTEAALSLGLYIDTHQRERGDMAAEIARAYQDREERLSINRRIREELGSPANLSPEQITYMELEVRKRRLQAAFDRGQAPIAYAHQLPFVHAKSFLNAIWMIKSVFFQGKQLGPIAQQSTKADDAIVAAIPALKDVRDSASHADERIQRLAKGRPIPVSMQPLSPSITIGFIVDSLINHNITYTSADGRHGQVPVTRDTFDLCVRVSQDFINELPWRGYQRLQPQL
jgi:hypothetical protein